eukprot:5813062-Amphidinium_carterae.1
MVPLWGLRHCVRCAGCWAKRLRRRQGWGECARAEPWHVLLQLYTQLPTHDQKRGRGRPHSCWRGSGGGT